MKKSLIVFIITITCFIYVNVNASNLEDSYTITFNTNGGSNITNQIVLESDTINIPNNPKKDGYIFDGWYTDSNYCNKYDFSKPVDSNIELYAKWIEGIKIYYDLNGGLPGSNYVDSTIISKANNKIKMSDIEIMGKPQDGYAFMGLDVNGKTYSRNISNITLTDDSNVKFLWNKIIYEVNINLIKPNIGESASMEKDENGNWNFEKPINPPKAYASDNSPYKVVETYWLMGFNGTDFDMPFDGTFENKKSYYAEIYIEAHDGYQFNDYISVKVNGYNIDTLILLENNSIKYGTSYMSVGKIITLNENITPASVKVSDNKTNNVQEKINVTNKIDNLSNDNESDNIIENSSNDNNIDISTNISNINNKIINTNNFRKDSKLYIWYSLLITLIIIVSTIYLKKTF